MTTGQLPLVPTVQRSGLAAPAPGRAGSTLSRHAAVALVLTGLGVALTYVLPSFRTYQLSMFMVYFAAAAGLTVLIGLNGQLSLGHGAIMAVGGYATGFTQNFLAGRFVDPPPPGASGLAAVPTVQSWTILVSLAIGVVAATAVGLIIGLAAARLHGPYLAGATLALVGVVPSVTATFDVFNGDQGIAVQVTSSPLAAGSAAADERWRAWVAMGLVALAVVLLANLVRSRIGREFRAVRDDEVAAQLAGIRVARTKVVAFIVSAAAAGLAGGLLVSVSWSAQPGMFGLNLSLYLVFAIVIGGLGSLAGAAWGALLLVVLIPDLIGLVIQTLHVPANLVERVDGSLGTALFGLSLMLIPILAPRGLQTVLRGMTSRRPAGLRPR